MRLRLLRPSFGFMLFACLLLAPGPASAANRTYIVTDFDSVRLDAPIDVTVETGRGVSARGAGDSDLLERVDLSVSARILTIRLKPSPYEGRKGDTGIVRLALTVPTLRRIQLSGAGSLQARGLDRTRAEIDAAGSGSLIVTGIDSDMLTIAQLGSGSVTLAGKAKSAVIHVSGAGSIDAKALAAADLDVRLDGTAAVSATAIRAAKIFAIGAGSVEIGGKAACTVNHAGSGIVRCSGKSF